MSQRDRSYQANGTAVAEAPDLPTMDVANFAPTHDFMVVKRLRRGETKGGIALPDMGDDGESVEKAIVVSMGPGRESDLMDFRTSAPQVIVGGKAVSIEVGDVVSLMPPNACGVWLPFEYDGDMHIITRFKDVVGVYGKKPQS